MDSPYWIKSKKEQLVSIVKKIINAFNTLYIVVLINRKTGKKNLKQEQKLNLLKIYLTGNERITHQKEIVWEISGKIIEQLLSMFGMIRTREYILPTIQNIKS